MAGSHPAGGLLNEAATRRDTIMPVKYPSPRSCGREPEPVPDPHLQYPHASFQKPAIYREFMRLHLVVDYVVALERTRLYPEKKAILLPLIKRGKGRGRGRSNKPKRKRKFDPCAILRKRGSCSCWSGGTRTSMTICFQLCREELVGRQRRPALSVDYSTAVAPMRCRMRHTHAQCPIGVQGKPPISPSC